MPQHYEIIQKISSSWNEAERHDAVLLRALCVLSQRHPDKTHIGFSPQDLAEEVSNQLRRPWSDPTDKGKISTDVRKLWNKLLKTWEIKKEGIYQHLSYAGIDEHPILCKTEGGGAGRQSKYRIEWHTREEQASDSGQEQVMTPPLSPNAQSVRYICEDIEEAGLLARIFSKGYRINGWRKWLLLTFIALPMIAVWLMLVLSLFSFSMWAVIGTRTVVSSFVAFAVCFVALIYTIGPILDLSTKKIVIAPWWMQSTDNDRLLEHRSQPRYKDRSVKAVRYVATCPICSGKISAKSGGIEFWGRVVGRCENTPTEHVFSFDHVSRNGMNLRLPLSS